MASVLLAAGLVAVASGMATVPVQLGRGAAAAAKGATGQVREGRDRLRAAWWHARSHVERRLLLARLAWRRVVQRFPGSPVVATLSATDDQGVARLAANRLREVLAPAAGMLGVPVEVVDEVWLVVVGSPGEMSGVLGRRYGASTLGAYWRGVLVLLSPRAWLDVSEPGWEERFNREGPVVHELTHLLLDRATLGRVPAWLDEGIAQYVEYTLTGYEWTEGDEGMAGGGYPLDLLAGSFRSLPEEAVAYREAFLFVRFVVERGGEGSLAELVRRLGRREDGLSAAAALAGVEPRQLEAAWRSWLRQRS